MTNEHEQRIRELAHHIWESEGCPQGEELRHWHMAERLLEASGSAPAVKKSALPRAPKAGDRSIAARNGDAAARPARRRRSPTPKGNTP